nr:hypothetical protein [Gammaproteobacteria bacterium]
MTADGDLNARLIEAVMLDGQERFDEAAAICEQILVRRPEQPHVLCL